MYIKLCSHKTNTLYVIAEQTCKQVVKIPCGDLRDGAERSAVEVLTACGQNRGALAPMGSCNKSCCPFSLCPQDTTSLFAQRKTSLPKGKHHGAAPHITCASARPLPPPRAEGSRLWRWGGCTNLEFRIAESGKFSQKPMNPRARHRARRGRKIFHLVRTPF